MSDHRQIKKSATARQAFENFRAKIRIIANEQNAVFANIMRRIDEKKLAAARERIQASGPRDAAERGETREQ